MTKINSNYREPDFIKGNVTEDASTFVIYTQADTWEELAEAINQTFGNENYDAESLQAEYPNYLTIYQDGAVLRYL